MLQQGLIVANHRSYFDPIIMLNHRQTFPVGKGSRIMAAHRYLCKISVILLIEKILKVDKTPEKIKGSY
jgi:1-acyl-sn-glycerol-3-phosphate acyltransferase